MQRLKTSNDRLLHTCKIALPEKGGVQIVANEIFKSLSKDFQSTLVSTSSVDSSKSPKIDNLIYVLKKPWFEIKSLPIVPGLISTLWRLSKNSSALIVHYPFPLVDIAIGLWPKRFKKIIVYWHSDIFEQKILKKLLSPFTQTMLSRASAIIVSSPKLIEHSTFLQQHKSKCIVIPFGYMPQSKVEIKDDGYYLCIGRHVKYKGINFLIQASAKTLAKIKVVGTGPLLDKHMALAKKLDISDRVEFVQGASDSKIVELICQSRALILPSISPNEAFGLVQIEAMSYGKPIINTDLPSAVPWVARNGIEAITVSPGNAQEITNAINKLENDLSLRQKLSKNAFNRWQSTFSLEKFNLRTLQLFNEIRDK